MTLSDIERLAASIPQKPLKELRFYDLYQAEFSSWGLYFIESPCGDMLYIGKATSRSVGDRVSAHLDCRDSSFLNSLPKAVLKSRRYNSDNKVDINNRLNDIITELREWNISVLFVEFDDTSREYTKHLIQKIESLLIYDYRPKGKCINSSHRKTNIDINKPIKTFI